MKLSKALMIAAMGLVSLNLVACSSMQTEREPANQAAGDQVNSPAQNQQSNEDKMAQWEQHHNFGSINRR